MTTWILIILVHVGVMGKTDSNSITSVPGFSSAAECQAAGAAASSLTSNTVKDTRFVCVKQTAPEKK